MTVFFQVLTLICLPLSYLLLLRKTKALNPVFGIFVVFAILYLFFGELYFVKADNFSPEIYRTTAIINLSCAIAVLISVLVSRNDANQQVVLSNLTDFELVLARLGYIAIFVFGYFLLFLNYNRFGGILEFFDIGSRADRNYQMREQPGNYPFATVLYAAFVVGIVVEYFAKRKYGYRKISGLFFVFTLIFPLMILHFVDGERSHLLKYVIVITCLYFSQKEPIEIFQHKKLILASLFIALVLSISLGATRTITNKILQGDYASAKVSAINLYRALPRSVLPNEFAAIASTTHYVLAKKPESLGGDSYLNSFIHPIPRRFLKNEKPLPIADELSQAWAKDLFTYDENCNNPVCEEEKQQKLHKRRTFSVSISPGAEAIWNFGVYWPFFMYFLFSGFLILIDRWLRSKSLILVGFALGSSFISLALHRSAFAGVFSFELYVLLFVVVPLWMIRPCSKFLRKIWNV